MNSYITHCALYVSDIEKTKEFYVKYFDGTANEKYTNSKGFQSYFIKFKMGASLEVMTHVELQVRKAMDKVNGFSHIAFAVGSDEKVREITDILVKDGYELLSPVRVTGDGYYESCIADPEGNRVEITV